jgi:hypothetical protein
MLGLLLLLVATGSGQDIGGYCGCKSCLEVDNDTYYAAEDQGDRCGQGCLMVKVGLGPINQSINQSINMYFTPTVVLDTAYRSFCFFFLLYFTSLSVFLRQFSLSPVFLPRTGRKDSPDRHIF